MHRQTASAQAARAPPAEWSRYEDKLFEHALVAVAEDSPQRWQLIGHRLNRPASQVFEHYQRLVQDIDAIESGLVEPPTYSDDPASCRQIDFEAKPPRFKEAAEKKKGNPWTENEHRLFLLGLQTYGKGDWRSIARHFVKTRTPTQVASHAQKFYMRQMSMGKKERKRTSIHDITTVDTPPVPASVNESFNPPHPGNVQDDPSYDFPQASNFQQMQHLQLAPFMNQLPDQGGGSLGYENFSYLS
ncbi:uncharacterized protein J3R85_020062 [Psidium guajava]|nr:uncharacterized protein J3R85_020062 [Psidium guajava]